MAKETVNTLPGLLDKMWNDYISINPQVLDIYNVFVERGEKVINDHIALRTYDLAEVCADQLAKPFIASGYVEKGQYHFEEKKLNAKHYEHPDENYPRIFISELITSEFSSETQAIIKKLVEQVDEKNERFDFTSMGRPWKVTSEEYNKLLEESEYAAWVAAHGYKPNHFTVFVNHLETIPNLVELNEVIRENGFLLNERGGAIKGSPSVYLEQSSTMAGKVEMKFDDEITLKVPACYYEFAQRYPLENGRLFSGFVAKSADKIFESTNINK
ncbi:DUF1338 domain-containing protein [Aureibacter tunicatorum]|uniref:2-oxoadipate dioxygenase/decarboxylase n=1 Tax=Aureibacter tunicatorum TaxID=866807 RepID=A0AAE3XSL6_9BACT|nr:DUF1338 domain-containing protein [Aureibacter tunicatorum]MDR6241245.1 hypothetical protein [Aureibacter tunicatorum]BDD03505.1 DUF1338 domain-containing protein [Aureibacter tunicatorum]